MNLIVRGTTKSHAHFHMLSLRPDLPAAEAHPPAGTVPSKTVAIVLPDLRIGGAERVALNLAGYFLDQGHAVTIVLAEQTGAYLAQLDGRATVVGLSAPRIRNAIAPLAEYLRREKPDATIAFMWPLTVATVIARMLTGSKTRLLVTEHTTWSRSELVQSLSSRLVARATMNLAFRTADAIVCVSEGAADDLAQFAGIDRHRVHSIYNPIVRDPLPAGRLGVSHEPRSWWTGSHKRILAVGNLIPSKGFGTLVRSFAEVRSKLETKLLVLGEGPARAQLESDVRDLKLEGEVFFPGSVHDPTPYYSRADLSVVSSEVEGFGNVLVEALACGTPVVSTDCPSGPREILAGGEFGPLVPVGDAPALARAMMQTLVSPLSPDLLRRRAGVFSVASAGRRYEELLFPQAIASALNSPKDKVQA